MSSFEQVFGATEAAAAAARESANGVVKQARALEKAAQTGNIASIGRAQRNLQEALEALREPVQEAVSCWRLTDDEVERRLRESYAAELQAAADAQGLEVFERDGLLFSYPCLVRVVPGQQAVRVDRKKVSTIRPGHLVGILLKNREKSSGFPSNRFIECLYKVYCELLKEQRPDLAGAGRVVPLARIYGLITALPGSAREYDRTDFARDLYALESEGPDRTRSGAVVSFPASTGTRRQGDVFSFVGPTGDLVHYYGISFTD